MVVFSRFINAFYRVGRRGFLDGGYRLWEIGKSFEMNEKTKDKPEKTEKEHKDDEEKYPKRKPRGALFESGDPTLARQLAEDPYGSKR